MSERPPTNEELGHIMSIRGATEGRDWAQDGRAIEQRLAIILRIFAASRQRKRDSDWAARKYRREREARGGNDG